MAATCRIYDNPFGCCASPGSKHTRETLVALIRREGYPGKKSQHRVSRRCHVFRSLCEQTAQFLVDYGCTEQDDSMFQAMQQMRMAYSR
jgi:hypothetical protein